MKKCFIFFLFIVCLNRAIAETGESHSIPVYYPEGTVGSASPYFIWYDKNNKRDKGINVKYRITIKSEQKAAEPLIITPEMYNEYYYYFKIPFILEQEKYKYMIERMVNSKPQSSKYFSYRKYPVSGEFTIDYKEKSQIDDLPPEMLIKYIKLDEENRLVNGYNFIFYSTAAIGSFGIGYLFYKILDFGIISRIIYTIAFTSCAVGIGASGYYGYKYIKGKNELHKILDISKDVTFNGDYSLTETFAGCTLSY